MQERAASVAMQRLKVRLLPAVAALIVVAVTVSLGNWQTRRAEQKQALQERSQRLMAEPPVRIGAALIDAQAVERRRVVLSGEWVAAKAVLLDHRQRKGIAGYHVLMPLRISGGGRHVLVDRGWIAAGAQRERLPAVTTPKGVVEVAGEARSGISSYLELSHVAPAGQVWQNLSLEHYAHWSGLELQPWVVLQTDDAEDGLLREWDRPDFGIDRHRGYALQWYSLAVLVCVLFVVLSLKRRKADEA